MAPDDTRSTIVLVTGSGRSGTSALAGTLKRLGLEVPQPEVPADHKNPRGYYEPQWVMDFHKPRLKALAVHNIDSRPDAPRIVEESLEDGEAQAELTEWLTLQLARGTRHLVIKDPHAYWFASIWRDAAAAVGADLRLLTSIRHPVEVAGSRDLAYLQDQPEELRRSKETSNITGWVHSALLTEAAGRGLGRAFLRYDDLMSDWRPALRRVGEQLGLDFSPAPEDGSPHPVDDFLDQDLRRSRLTWDDVNVPSSLREMAEEVWLLVNALVEDPGHHDSQVRLDRIHAEYDDMYRASAAIVFDHTQAKVVAARRELQDKLKQARQRVRQQQRTLEDLRTPSRPHAAARLANRLRRR